MRKLMILFVIFILIADFSPTALAATQDPVKVIVDGKQLLFPDAPAYIDTNNRTQVPVRFVMEELGCSVGWNSATKYATITRGEKTVQFIIGQSIYKVNGVTMSAMDTQAVLRNSRTYVPIRYATEAFGASVRWDGDTRTVYVDSTGKVAEDPESAEATEFDDYGLLKLEYAEPLYQKLLDSMKIVYEDDTPYFCYTVPDNIPENMVLDITINGDLKDNAPTELLGWLYQTSELSTGHRADDKYDYLLPVSGTVKKALTPIDIKYFKSINIGIQLNEPPWAIWTEKKRAAHSTWHITIYPNKPRESYIFKEGRNAKDESFPNYPKTVKLNTTNMIQK